VNKTEVAIKNLQGSAGTQTVLLYHRLANFCSAWQKRMKIGRRRAYIKVVVKMGTF